jgi:hypothetical protein
MAWEDTKLGVFLDRVVRRRTGTGREVDQRQTHPVGPVADVAVVVLVGGQEEPCLHAGDAKTFQLTQVAAEVRLKFGACQQCPAVRRPCAVEPVLVGMRTHVMALGQHLPDQRRELCVAQEVAGEKERCLGTVPGQCLQDGSGSLRKLMAGKHQR